MACRIFNIQPEPPIGGCRNSVGPMNETELNERIALANQISRLLELELSPAIHRAMAVFHGEPNYIGPENIRRQKIRDERHSDYPKKLEAEQISRSWDHSEIMQTLVRLPKCFNEVFGAPLEKSQLIQDLHQLVFFRNKCAHPRTMGPFTETDFEHVCTYAERVLRAAGRIEAADSVKKLRETKELTKEKLIRKFTGCQSDLKDPRTREIISTLSLAKGKSGNLYPVSLQTLEFQLQPYSADIPAIKRQKFSLYAGAAAMPMSPLNYATARLTFHRKIATNIANEIATSDELFTSHTIVARSGQGKSIALGQVLVQLAEMPGVWSFWSFDPAAPFRCDQGVAGIEKYFDMFRSLGDLPKRLVFLFDDYSLRKPECAKSILEFHEVCRNSPPNGVCGVSFVFAVTERADAVSSKALELDLVDTEEDDLYDTLTRRNPIIAHPRYPSFDEMLSAFPTEKKNFQDDVQGLIDFILSHSDPVEEFKPLFYDVANEAPLVKELLSVLAVSQLLDLPLPRHIANRFAELFGVPARNVSEFQQESKHISLYSPIEGDSSGGWPGYRLTSPYRARSILRNLGRFEEEYIRKVYREIFAFSIDRAVANPKQWLITDSEFIRHLLQRLANTRGYAISTLRNKASLADELFTEYGAIIFEILGTQQDSNKCARWAGTLCQLGALNGSKSFRSDPIFIERMIYSLCQQTIADKQAMVESRIFVSTLKAVRRLCINFPEEELVRSLAEAAIESVNLTATLEALVTKSDSQWSYRANETILSYVNLASAFYKLSKMRHVKSKILGTYERIEAYFNNRDFHLDAGNTLERARCVEILGPHDNYHIRLRAKYLIRARDAVRTEIRQQGKWKEKVDREIRNFERRSGSVEALIIPMLGERNDENPKHIIGPHFPRPTGAD